MGWFRNFMNRIRGVKELPEESQPDTYNLPTNTIDQYTVANGDEIALKVANENELNIQREGYLNQLGNSAVEIARTGGILNPEELIQYAEKRGARPIDISSENKLVELVDVKAAISLGYAIANGYVQESMVNSLGGKAKIIDEMSTQAKETAEEYQMSSDCAGDFLKHPTQIIEDMQEDLEKQQTMDE